LSLNNTIIKAKNLSKTIKNYQILKNLDFEIQKGSFIGLLGPSGSGKTTLLNILGLMDSFSGELSILGHDVKSLSNTEKAELRNKNIGFIFQSHLLLPELNLLENIKLPQQLSKNKAFDALEICESIGLKDKINNLPSELSTGEQQRGAFARAIINKPQLVLADEPTGNLDKNNKKIIFDLLKKYSQDFSATIIVASHDEMVEKYSDYTFQIDDGKLF